MTDGEWYSQLKRTLTPHLEVLRREVQKQFPALDGELTLLHFLCKKHNLNPPLFSFKKVDDYESSGGGKLQGPLPITPRNKIPPLTPLKSSTPFAGNEGAMETTFSGQTASTATPRTTFNRSLPWAQEPLVDLTGGPLANDVQEEPKNEHGHLRTLESLTAKVQRDAHNHTHKVGTMRQRDGKLTGVIQDLRNDFRGAFLEQVPLFSRDVLTPEEQLRLVGRVRPWNFGKGQNIIVEGEEGGDRLYVVESGQVDVIKKVRGVDRFVCRLERGDFFGEMATLDEVPRTATIRTVSDVTALSLTRQDLMATVRERNLKRLRVIARTQVFSSIPIVTDLSAKQMVRVAEALERKHFIKDTLVYLPGAVTKRMHIVEKGQFRLEDEKVDYAHLPKAERGELVRPGDFFGMSGLITGSPVGAKVTTDSDVAWTLSISWDELLATAEPELRDRMEATMCSSMKSHFLRQIPQLQKLSDTHFEHVKSHTEERTYKKWTVICNRGDPIENVYILWSGKVAETQADTALLQSDRSLEVNVPEHAMPGTNFGIECLTQRRVPTNRTIVALTDVTLLQLNPAPVWTVLHEERSHISKIPMFSSNVISKKDQYLLVGKLKPWTFPSGRNIISEGDIGDTLFIIERGVCDTIKLINGKEVVQSHLKRGDFFGELAVMYNAPTRSTIRAATEVSAVSLSREDLLSTLGLDKINKMRSVARTRVFNDIPVLANLTADQKISLGKKIRTDHFQRGSVLVEEDQETDRVYIIEEGDVQIWAGSEKAGVLASFQCFGMEGLLFGEPYRRRFTAIGMVTTLSVSLDDVYEAAGTGERPSVERNMTDSLHVYLFKQVPQLRSKGEENEDFFKTLLNHIEVVDVPRGTVVCTKGSTFKSLHILERGMLVEADTDAADPCKKQEVIAGGFFGEECLVKDGPAYASATLQAAMDSVLLKVPSALVKPALTKRATFAEYTMTSLS